MAGQIFSGISQAIGACFVWFEQVMSTLGFAGIIIGAFTILTVSRFLLKPLVGGGVGKSDRVSRKGSSKGSEEVDG